MEEKKRTKHDHYFPEKSMTKFWKSFIESGLKDSKKKEKDEAEAVKEK